MTAHSSQGASPEIQQLLLREYIAPARRRGKHTVRVIAGDLVRALRLGNRVPHVCSAMQSQRFLRENSLEIVGREGPPSMQSTTVAITYRLAGSGGPDHLDSLYGRLRGVFAAEGGGEKFHAREKAAWERGRRP